MNTTATIVRPFLASRGVCGACGRNLTLGSSNKTGARCRFDGAQYDRAGNFLGFNYRRPPFQS